jgi:hypothetical protein
VSKYRPIGGGRGINNVRRGALLDKPSEGMMEKGFTKGFASEWVARGKRAR